MPVFNDVKILKINQVLQVENKVAPFFRTRCIAKCQIDHLISGRVCLELGARKQILAGGSLRLLQRVQN